ncbi:MAG: sulfatase [Verrucomicrobia bacterium 61-8]|nr:MAG: sulfatase [Verrucomicrobia bacterium 61-8]
MKAIIVMFDSLNRHMLPCYGCDWVHAPNFERLAKRSVTFDSSYVCSMPCIPARRDLHTGRPNFLHRGWGPLEPWDDSFIEMLKKHAVYTHLTTDHYHYFEAGGANYHTKYNSFESFRGQEGDPWRGEVTNPEPVPGALGQNAIRDAWHFQDLKNRAAIRDESDFPQAKTFDAGLRFIRENLDADNWLVQIETFDPHEPFFSPESCKQWYQEHYDRYEGPHFDWPNYRRVKEPSSAIEHLRHENASLISLCDRKLGEILDLMDKEDLWEDTMLVVWTDHGFLLGEHESYGKCWIPFYQEIAHTPFFVWDPRCKVQGERRRALVQPAIDLAPTLLRYFGLAPTPDMLGHDLADVVASDQSVRKTAAFGIFGGQVNVTDGRYVYMRSAATLENKPLYQYTLTPAHADRLFSPEELAGKSEFHPPLSFTKGCPVLRIEAAENIRATASGHRPELTQTQLYDIESDPLQQTPMQSPEIEKRMIAALESHLRTMDAPSEQWDRLGLR